MTMSTVNHPRERYSFIFVAIVLGLFVFVMSKTWTKGIDGFDKNFYEKKTLIGAYNYLRYQMGDHDFPQVVVGRSGWLLFDADGNLNSYQNVYLYEDRLKNIHDEILVLDRYLKSRGIKLIVVVAPNKETIYPNKVPPEIKRLNDSSRLDLLLEMFDEADASIMLDLRAPLREMRKDHQIYYQTDSHWNPYGAYVAYREIVERASQAYSDLQPYNINDFEFIETAPQILDIANLLGGDFLQEPRITIQSKFSTQVSSRQISPFSGTSILIDDSKQERNLLMYHDSFGVALNNFLKYNFAEVIYIHNNSSDDGFAMTNWINILEPDVIVIEIVERDILYLDNLLSKLSGDLGMPDAQP